MVEIPDETQTFCFTPPKSWFKPFVHGWGLYSHTYKCLSYAAWGVLSATDGDLVAIGHLSGITQSIDRAELTAILAALRWSTLQTFASGAIHFHV